MEHTFRNGEINMIFTKGELFSGPGGLALGAKLASVKHEGEEYKIEHKWAYDYDKDAVETFRNNICPDKECTVNVKDVRELDIDKTEEIDAFTFGFPCNDFSNVGEKKGFAGEFGPLYTYGVKVLNKHSPKWFLAENVGGLGSANEGYAFQTILRDLTNAGEYGYKLTAHLYKFEEYGIPQMRHRIIIVGIRSDLPYEFKVPAPTTPNISDYVAVGEALRDIPADAPNQEETSHPDRIKERLKAIPEGGNAWHPAIPESLRLNVKGAKLSNIYRKLDRNKPAYTVTGSGGGGTHMYHYVEPRALTNRERARIQTFPDNYKFYGGKESVRKQIGMAVPPKGAKIIFEAILKTFAGIIYDSVEPKWDVEDLKES
jgi:DNA (cytosine-5)-methyltransferase 1